MDINLNVNIHLNSQDLKTVIIEFLKSKIY